MLTDRIIVPQTGTPNHPPHPPIDNDTDGRLLDAQLINLSRIASELGNVATLARHALETKSPCDITNAFEAFEATRDAIVSDGVA